MRAAGVMQLSHACIPLGPRPALDGYACFVRQLHARRGCLRATIVHRCARHLTSGQPLLRHFRHTLLASSGSSTTCHAQLAHVPAAALCLPLMQGLSHLAWSRHAHVWRLDAPVSAGRSPGAQSRACLGRHKRCPKAKHLTLPQTH